MLAVPEAEHMDVRDPDGAAGWRDVARRAIAAEAALDGFYVIRTNLPKEAIGAKDAVSAYKNLAQVERAFRSLKTADLDIRPIYHWLSDRARAHVFTCSCACWPITWNGICAGSSPPCCLTMRIRRVRSPPAPAIETNPHPGSKPTAQSLTFCLPTHLKLVTSSPSKIRRLSFQNS
jgi:hypothetical protein